nr:isoform 2 of snw/ski-interacting protein [Quercus suber]
MESKHNSAYTTKPPLVESNLRSEFGLAVTGLCFIMRAGFVPRKAEDFGDGGAFPEIHIEQYPLDMGRDRLLKPGSKIVPVIIDTHGNIAYDAIVRQNENSNKILYSQHKDLEPKVMKYDCEEKCDDEELKKEIEKTTVETKAALEKIFKFF